MKFASIIYHVIQLVALQRNVPGLHLAFFGQSTNANIMSCGSVDAIHSDAALAAQLGEVPVHIS